MIWFKKKPPRPPIVEYSNSFNGEDVAIPMVFEGSSKYSQRQVNDHYIVNGCGSVIVPSAVDTGREGYQHGGNLAFDPHKPPYCTAVAEPWMTSKEAFLAIPHYSRTRWQTFRLWLAKLLNKVTLFPAIARLFK